MISTSFFDGAWTLKILILPSSQPIIILLSSIFKIFPISFFPDALSSEIFFNFNPDSKYIPGQGVNALYLLYKELALRNETSPSAFVIFVQCVDLESSCAFGIKEVKLFKNKWI